MRFICRVPRLRRVAKLITNKFELNIQTSLKCANAEGERQHLPALL
jgi:hypothetical protein